VRWCGGGEGGGGYVRCRSFSVRAVFIGLGQDLIDGISIRLDQGEGRCRHGSARYERRSVGRRRGPQVVSGSMFSLFGLSFLVCDSIQFGWLNVCRPAQLIRADTSWLH